MLLPLPKPINGWRVFLGEVGIIVLGVLLALGAQQLVDSVRARSDVADFRAAVYEEIAQNLATYPYHAQQTACIQSRLDDLQQWLDQSRAGRVMKLNDEIGIPSSLVIRTSAWESRDPATLAYMPRSERLEIGAQYSEFANNELHRLDERAAWLELANFNGLDRLTHEDQMRLQGLIFRARLRARRMMANYERFLKRATAMGIAPKSDPTWPVAELKDCEPLLTPQSHASAT